MFYDNINFFTPEPASLALLGLGGLVVLRRRKS
ncbi:MAG: PEP-CTERM sorting domain-containing protein [Phycisphaerales bacterium]|nr:PEP-CTERM sorting domain-containing protein [Phycisphaerales bacterium]